ncbi:MAG: cbb3-type cytochrome c oxidase subunit I [Candidatus Eremiobacteraeota bacterium]|nr:cbb3-type cytochrome c oxidase subunit I [Candidatus Eremiobacteraeota bacterium]MBV8365862.1 cbb3-type cytochrome c oxidase subunit I [Candidatus Eremiobacteraeota bacterium]
MTISELQREASHAHIHPPPQGFVSRYVISFDHKVIAVQYFITSGLFFVLAGLLAEMIRAQLMQPHNTLLSAQTFSEAYSVHGSAMVWLVIIPVLTGGFGNLAMPLMIGARDVAFPWLNMFSFWLFPPAGILVFLSFLYGAPQAGWTEYPPVSLHTPGTALWCAGIFLIGVSSTITGINFMVTIIKMRAPGMTWTRMPLFVWATLVTAFLSAIATANLSAALAALFIEKIFHVPFYDPANGGSPVLWQHVFWFYSHPAVYIMILPAFGIVSEVLPTFVRRPIFGYRAIAYSSVAIGLVSFMVWAHHMFTSGLAQWVQLPFMILTMAVGIPTGIKIFSWVATLWRGRIRLSTPLLFVIGFLSCFTFGGITGVMLASVPADIHEHATYFVIAHLHYVLFGGSIFGIFAGLYYWWPKMTGRLLDERLGKIHFWVMFLAFNATFLPMHWLGLLGMQRRVAFYDNQFEGTNLLPMVAHTNVFVSISAFVLGLSMLIFAYNALRSATRGQVAGPNPWGARTLEWMTSSPPPYYNFAEIPLVLHGPYDYGKPLPYANISQDLATEPVD